MIKNKIKTFADEFEGWISELLPEKKCEYSLVQDAMRYSIADGGKRLRPFLIKSFYEAAGGCDKSYKQFALAIECIHSYSLVHDDLPCMDNDDMRRGKPSCHKKFGEEYALLAGDGLLTLAFSAAAKTENIPASRVISASALLADLAGVDGMVGGQTVDLLWEEKSDVTTETLTLICSLKTGALIKAACLIGATLAGADDKMLKAAEEYAENLGLAFQIVDDILDIVGEENKLGKPINSDAENGKSTFVSLFGIEKCKEMVNEFTKKAKDALSVYGDGANDLILLADYLCKRDY